MDLISPSSNDAVSRRRGDGSYALGVTGTAFRSAVSFARPDNATGYTAGDVIGIADSGTPANAGSAIHTLSNIGPAGGYVLVQSARLVIGETSVPAGIGVMRLHFYNASPTAILDNAAFDLVAGDVAKYLGFVDMIAPTDFGSHIVTQVNAPGLMIKMPSSTTLYAQLQSIGAYTPTAEATFDLEVLTLEQSL